jgi:DNA polymerase-1
MTLLLVDAANILLRCAFGGDTPPEQSTPIALGMIERAIRETRAKYLVVALDYPGDPSWRSLECPDYKANRSRDTSPWLIAGATAFGAKRWRCEVAAGFEADDIIATLATRAAARSRVVILSGDSDLLALTAHRSVDVLRPISGGEFDKFDGAAVCAKYEIPAPQLLADFKAMVGESTDNIAGVPGIGAKRAAALLQKFSGGLEDIIRVGQGGYSRDAERVAQHAAAARLALRLVTLRTDVAIDPIPPSACAVA